MNAPSFTVNQRKNVNENSTFTMLAVNALQQMQIEQYRLSFLLRCRVLKRPPPSLRCTGFKALDENVRIRMISETETVALENAILKKKKELKLLTKKVQRTEVQLPALSKNKKKKWRAHFNKKIKFLKSKVVK